MVSAERCKESARTKEREGEGTYVRERERKGHAPSKHHVRTYPNAVAAVVAFYLNKTKKSNRRVL